MYIDKEVIDKHLSSRTFGLVSEAADELGLEAYGRGSTTRGILRDLNLLQDDRALSANAQAVRNLLEENFPEPFTWR